MEFINYKNVISYKIKEEREILRDSFHNIEYNYFWIILFKMINKQIIKLKFSKKNNLKEYLKKIKEA
jgi:hypothetical protein